MSNNNRTTVKGEPSSFAHSIAVAIPAMLPSHRYVSSFFNFQPTWG